MTSAHPQRRPGHDLDAEGATVPIALRSCSSTSTTSSASTTALDTPPATPSYAGGDAHPTSLRTFELAYCVGGEEFLVLLPDADADARVAQRLGRPLAPSLATV
jgi:hypothetical protein